MIALGCALAFLFVVTALVGYWLGHKNGYAEGYFRCVADDAQSNCTISEWVKQRMAK